VNCRRSGTYHQKWAKAVNLRSVLRNWFGLWLIGELVNLTKSSVRNGNNPASSDIRSVASALSEGAFVCTPSDDQALRIGHVLRIIRIGFIR
jgi:hypothetical protein